MFKKSTYEVNALNVQGKSEDFFHSVIIILLWKDNVTLFDALPSTVKVFGFPLCESNVTRDTEKPQTGAGSTMLYPLLTFLSDTNANF